MRKMADSVLSRIEELIKGNTFSREELRHLNGILDNQWEKSKSSIDDVLDTQLLTGTPEIRRPPSNEKQLSIDRNTIGTSGLKVPVGVGASPIDIARAYMASRNSEGSCERAQPRNELGRNPLLPSPSPKPSIRWPGAMVHDRHGYATPQSQSARHRLHDFPRTPYSRTMLSKSKTKLQAVSGYENTPTPFQQSQTPFYGQVKSKGENVDGYGSVGPIRRTRNKFSSEVRPRGSIFGPPKDNHLKTVEPAIGRFLPSTRSLGLVETSGASKYSSAYNKSDSSDRDISDPDFSSSEAVRKILEHLDRTKPTPKEKQAELKLATTWKKPSSSNATLDENISSVQVEELASSKNTAVTSANITVGISKSNSKPNFLLDEVMEEVTNGNAKPSSSNFTGPGENALPFFGLKGRSGPEPKSSNENAFAQKSLLFPHPPHLSNGQSVKMVAGTTTSELSKNKPSLPPISISKPDFRAVSSENAPGFTFPVSASSGVLSEPPTPSITPSSSLSALAQPTFSTDVPNYSFGTNKSSPPLVFSFPSSSSGPTQDDSDPKFSFGSDGKTRLSFASLGEDNVCY